jgi:hypothetical protein
MEGESRSIVGLPGILFRLCHKNTRRCLLPRTSLTCLGSDGTDKRLHPFVFDVFTEDDDELVDDGQLPAKRRRRASSASSSVHAEQARTPPVVNLPHDIEVHTGFTRKEETMEGHEWQAQRIVGERQTPSGAGVRSQLGEDAVAALSLMVGSNVAMCRLTKLLQTRYKARQ